MRSGLLCSALVAAVTLSALRPPMAKAQDASVVVLVNATVVDVEKGALVLNQSIVTQHGRILRVGSSATIPVPRGARRIDLNGRFVIPGLWDMHVHMASAGPTDALAAYYGSLFLRHGVTAVRDGGGSAGVLAVFDSIGRARPGAMPRIIHAGEKLGPVEGRDFGIADVRSVIAERTRAGAKHIKLVPVFPFDLFQPTLASCAAAGLKCVAHIPASDTGLWLSAPGRGSYEHLFHLPEHVSRVPAAELFAATREYEAPTIVHRVMYKLRLRHRPLEPPRLYATRDTARDAAFFERLAASKTWFTPTLLLHHYMTKAVDLDPAAIDSQLTLTPWPVNPTRSAELRQAATHNWGMWNGIVKAMSTAGVNLLAGSDFFAAHVPGAVLHTELALLQQAGVPPPEVLRMATINPARYLDATDTLGSISAGRVADLVVLRGNPLEDARRVADVEMVMARGRLFQLRSLDSLTSAARVAAARIREARR